LKFLGPTPSGHWGRKQTGIEERAKPINGGWFLKKTWEYSWGKKKGNGTSETGGGPTVWNCKEALRDQGKGGGEKKKRPNITDKKLRREELCGNRFYHATLFPDWGTIFLRGVQTGTGTKGDYRKKILYCLSREKDRSKTTI